LEVDIASSSSSVAKGWIKQSDERILVNWFNSLMSSPGSVLTVPLSPLPHSMSVSMQQYSTPQYPTPQAMDMSQQYIPEPGQGNIQQQGGYMPEEAYQIPQGHPIQDQEGVPLRAMEMS
jgi:hypothetical protein